MPPRAPRPSSPVPTGTALHEAIARSFSVHEPPRALSPLRALGRRQLSGVEVMAQSIATTAPAASMIGLPLAMLGTSVLGGVLAIVASVAVMALIALCVSQFTRRLAAAGGLYTFVTKGAGRRRAMTVGVAMAVKYCGSAALTLYQGGQEVIRLLGALGIDARGPAGSAAVHCLVTAVILLVVVRGVRRAMLAILVVELCSLALIVGLLLSGDSGARLPQPGSPASSHATLLLVLSAMFALAGFESAAFLGPEAKRPLVTVTRTVLWTPVICGALFLLAAWAVSSGRAGMLLNAYTGGADGGVDPGLGTALHLGVMCSWLASAMASFNAASHLFYTMAVERILPSPFRRVHATHRTPHGALVAVAVLVCAVCLALNAARHSAAAPPVALRLTVQGALVIAYVLVTLACLRFLARIGESTPLVKVAATLASGAGTALLGSLLFVSVTGHDKVVPAALGAVAVSGVVVVAVLRRLRPGALERVGVFDSAESDDVLPGSASYGRNARGLDSLVRRP
ncbi:APC family permease [Streptomyces sp. YC504]|uniref:APC family permease n=1 Tax=Streptomyces mesophilus TaxID=1775132 RepID=A0A6G4XCV3_9ACTN|nr:APC family permease [Streptomyces mesophilus]NGO74554.1 APC family permease [Streptomyces mesophilus]